MYNAHTHINEFIFTIRITRAIRHRYWYTHDDKGKSYYLVNHNLFDWKWISFADIFLILKIVSIQRNDDWETNRNFLNSMKFKICKLKR